MKSFYGKEEAKVIQGIALLMMFACHFLTNFYFTQENKELYRWSGLIIDDLMIELHIQKAGQFCRALFAFVSGYAIYINREHYCHFKYCLKRIGKFLFRYWTVLFIFYWGGVYVW